MACGRQGCGNERKHRDNQQYITWQSRREDGCDDLVEVWERGRSARIFSRAGGISRVRAGRPRSQGRSDDQSSRSPKSCNSTVNKLMKSRYKNRAPIMAVRSAVSPSMAP